jgi:hypothetical protein
MFLGSKGRPVRGQTTLQPSVSRLFKQCGNLNISQPCRPPRPTIGIVLLFLTFLAWALNANEYLNSEIPTMLIPASSIMKLADIKVFMAENIKITLLWHSTPCSLVEGYQCFGGFCYLSTIKTPISSEKRVHFYHTTQ